GALEHVPGLWHQMGLVASRQGTLHWTRYFRVGRCRDGWVMHCTLGDWTSLVEWIKADGMGADLDDPALEDIKTRQAEADRLFAALDAWAARYTVEELVEGAQLRRIPYAAVRAPEALLRDAHLAARGFFVPIEHPGLGLARRLAAVSDVVIDNFSARVMTNLGLDYDVLVRLRPDVICVRMTGFGLTGPDRDHVSYGPTLQALTGYTLLMAEPGGPPAGFGYSYSDLAGGNLGALAVLAAIWHRRQTGRGQLVDLAQLETVASVLGPV